jgi:hypothetical protein
MGMGMGMGMQSGGGMQGNYAALRPQMGMMGMQGNPQMMAQQVRIGPLVCHTCHHFFFHLSLF